MTDKNTFVKMLNLALEQSLRLDRAAEFIQFDSPLIEFGWSILDQWLGEHFEERDLDTINWWLFECDGDAVIHVNGEKVPIQSAEDLWDKCLFLSQDDNK